MGRTRFMVVKAKELIKTAVFAVLGVIILVGLIAFFLNMGKHDGAYRDRDDRWCMVVVSSCREMLG